MKNVEVEIQVIIKDPEKIEARLNEVGKFVKSRKQIDKYFVPPQKDYFVKDMPDEYLRVRNEEEKNHLNYSFIHFSEDGWLMSTDEYETLVDKPEVAEEIFHRIGLILKVTFEKTRKYFDYGDFEVTLDKIKDLGNFIEIEKMVNLKEETNQARQGCVQFLGLMSKKNLF